MIGISWSGPYDPMRVKCIHRCLRAVACRSPPAVGAGTWVWGLAAIAPTSSVASTPCTNVRPKRAHGKLDFGQACETRLYKSYKGRTPVLGICSCRRGRVCIPFERAAPDEPATAAWTKRKKRLQAQTGRANRGEPSVELRSVTKRFGELTAVDDLSLEIGDGEFFTLLGP